MWLDDIMTLLKKRIDRAKAAVDDIDRNTLLARDETTIIDGIFAQYDVATPQLRFGEKYQENVEESNRSGRRFERLRVVIPLDGDVSILPQHIQSDYLYGTATVDWTLALAARSAKERVEMQ